MKTIPGHDSIRKAYPLPTFFLPLLISSVLVFSSCTNHATDPTEQNTLSTAVQLTRDGDANEIGWLDDGTDIVYVASTLHGSILEGVVKSVNLTTNVIRTLDDSLRIFNAFRTAGDSILYVTLNPDNSTGVYLISGINPQPVISLISDRAYNAMISPDHKLVAATSSGSLFLASTTSSSRSVLSLQSSEELAAFSPDSKQILLSSGRILDITNGSFSALPFSIPSAPVWLDWNSTGIWALTFTQDTTQTYYLTDLNSNNKRAIWSAPKAQLPGFVFAWSPDNNKIAVLRSTQMNVTPTVHYLYVCDISKKSATQIAVDTVNIHQYVLPGISSVAFSPDGSRIAYSANGNIFYQNL